MPTRGGVKWTGEGGLDGTVFAASMDGYVWWDKLKKRKRDDSKRKVLEEAWLERW